MAKEQELDIRKNPKNPQKLQYRAQYNFTIKNKAGKKIRRHGYAKWCDTKADARRVAAMTEFNYKQKHSATGVYLETVMDDFVNIKEKEVDHSSRSHISRFSVIKTTFDSVIGLHTDLNTIEEEQFRVYANYLIYEYGGLRKEGDNGRKVNDQEGKRISYNYYSSLRTTFHRLLLHAENRFGLNKQIRIRAKSGMVVEEKKEKINRKETPWKTEIKDKHRYLTEDEMIKMLEHYWRTKVLPELDKDLFPRSYIQYMVFKTIFYTGLRWEEIRCLTLADVKENHNKDILYVKYRTIQVNKAINERQYGIETNHLKTDDADRDLDLVGNMYPAFDNYYDFILERYHDIGIKNKKDMLLFPNPTEGETMLISNNVNRHLKKACMESLGFYTSVYGLRHSAAMYYINEVGLSLDATKIIFGHAEDSKMLEEVYALRSKKDRKKSLDAELEFRGATPAIRPEYRITAQEIDEFNEEGEYIGTRKIMYDENELLYANGYRSRTNQGYSFEDPSSPLFKDNPYDNKNPNDEEDADYGVPAFDEIPPELEITEDE